MNYFVVKRFLFEKQILDNWQCNKTIHFFIVIFLLFFPVNFRLLLITNFIKKSYFQYLDLSYIILSSLIFYLNYNLILKGHHLICQNFFFSSPNFLLVATILWLAVMVAVLATITAHHLVTSLLTSLNRWSSRDTSLLTRSAPSKHTTVAATSKLANICSVTLLAPFLVDPFFSHSILFPFFSFPFYFYSSSFPVFQARSLLCIDRYGRYPFFGGFY